MEKNRRWVVLGFIGLSLILAWMLGQGLQWLFYRLRDYGIRDIEILGSNFTLAHAIGFSTTLVVAILCWRNAKLNQSSHEVVEELRKVTWPTSKETQTHTIVVIITTIIMSIILWLFDFVWAWASSLIYGIQA